MKKIIKGSVLFFALVILVSLVYYVQDKKNRPPVSADLLLEQAQAQIRDHKNYAKAIELSREALAASPDYTDVEITLGRAYMLNGKLDSAKYHFVNAVEKNNRHEDGLQYLVNLLLLQKDTSAALHYMTVHTKAFPEKRATHLKQYGLLLDYRAYKSADSLYTAYTKRFNKDSINEIAHHYWALKAFNERRQDLLTESYRSYRQALRYQPRDTAILYQLVNLSIYRGNYRAALEHNQALLREDSLNSRYLTTASSIYQKINDPENAALYAGKAYALNPSDPAAGKNLAEMYLNNARDGSAQNKIRYARLASELLPSNIDALLYLFNGYMETGQYDHALQIANRALSYYPADPLFTDKKINVLYTSRQYASCLVFIESLTVLRRSVKISEVYQEVTVAYAAELLSEGDLTRAATVVEKGLALQNNNRALLEQLVNIYASQKNTGSALAAVERLLTISPGHENYLFKKAGLLETEGLLEAAVEITGWLYREHPYSTVYKKALLDQLQGLELSAVREGNWTKAISSFGQALQMGGAGYDHYVYGVAAYNGLRDYQEVLSVTGAALGYYPGDSLLTVKKSLALANTGRFPEALAITREIRHRFPADSNLQALYLEQLYTAGKYYEKNREDDSAIRIFLTAYDFAPKDTFALMNLAAIYFIQHKYDSSIHFADRGLQIDSNNIYLLTKKASAHEQLRQYVSAYRAAGKVQLLSPSFAHRDYADYLQNKSFVNQAGITHLHTFFAPSGQTAAITGLQYTRRFTKGSLTGKVNYGQRAAGNGIQVGLDAYYNHDSAYYSNVFVNGSTGKAFPYWNAGYSLFRNFKKGWEAEAGLRYLGFDSINNYTLTGAVGKYVHSTWLHARAYYTFNTKNWFQSYQLTVRQYLNDKNDYLSLIAGTGNIPDDQGLNYNLNSFSGFTSSSLGAGFQKQLRYKTIFQLFFNYTSLQVAASRRIGQYDVYLTLLRNF